MTMLRAHQAIADAMTRQAADIVELADGLPHEERNMMLAGVAADILWKAVKEDGLTALEFFWFGLSNAGPVLDDKADKMGELAG